MNYVIIINRIFTVMDTVVGYVENGFEVF